MGVPIVSEANKSKELLLEIDSIVPDTKGHRLADISLSSNDSLSQSRRRWKLIRIISKMNPSLQGKSKKLIFYQSLSALLALILTGITIYWLVSLNTASNLSFESPSSSSLSSSSSSFQISSRTSSELSSSTPTPKQVQSSSPSPKTHSVPYNITPFPPSNYAKSNDFDTIDYAPNRFDNPVLRLMEPSNDTNDDVNSKIDDSTENIEGFYDASDDGEPQYENEFDYRQPFPSSPLLIPPWSADQLLDAGRMFLPPPPFLFQKFSPFPSAPLYMSDPLETRNQSDEPSDDVITPPPSSSSNLAKIRLSAKRLHASAVGALDEIMRKLKDNQFIDFLVNGDDNLKPELIRSEDVGMYDPFDDEETESTVGFIDVGQLGNDDGTVDNLFNFIKKIVF